MKKQKTAYWTGFGSLILLLWANVAVGIIGSENQDANKLYYLVLACVILGMLLSRFKLVGMYYTFLIAAFIQLVIPFAANVIWIDLSWGGLGMRGVVLVNTVFAFLFVLAAVFFQKAIPPPDKKASNIPRNDT